MPELDSGDQQVFDQLVAHGADLSKPTNFIFFIHFATASQDAAQEISEALAAEGWDCRAVASGDDSSEGWTLFADRDEVPSPENFLAMRRQIEAAAERFGGEYDNWEAAVTK